MDDLDAAVCGTHEGARYWCNKRDNPGAVMASMGDTRVMCAAVTAREPDPNASFFNLNV